MHFHDLRYTGNMLAPYSRCHCARPRGADGHDSERAALICQHALQNAGQGIAAAIAAALLPFERERAASRLRTWQRRRGRGRRVRAFDAGTRRRPGNSGVPLRRSNFNKASGWSAAVAKVGVKGLHFHDLRHTGNMLAAATPGVTLRDLMARMGHDSERAALIYQHASQNADQGIAAAMTAGLLAFEQERAAQQQKPHSDDEGQDDDGGSGALVPTG